MILHDSSQAGNPGINVEVVGKPVGDHGAAWPPDRAAVIAEDLARMKAGPTGDEVHFRAVHGYWPPAYVADQRAE